MYRCQQMSGQSIYQHGCAVRDHTFQIIYHLRFQKELTQDWKLPEWLVTHRQLILKNLMDDSIIREYTTYHDCGKPYCQIIDQEGKNHFPNHAEVSAQIWLAAGGCPVAAKLMGMDMMVHTMKAADIDQFILHPEACTLLIVGLAEVHANAKMFGGIDSTSFKIKWNQINKRGKIILEKLSMMGANHVID